MGARAVYDGPVLISLVPNEEGMLSGGRTLSEGVALCDEYGADVIGVVSDAPARVLVGFAKKMASSTDKPLLVDVSVRRKDRRQFEPTDENPYPTADAIVELAVRLRAQGVQFLRAQLIRVHCSQRLAAAMLWCRISVLAACVTAIERGKRGTRKKSRLWCAPGVYRQTL